MTLWDIFMTSALIPIAMHVAFLALVLSLGALAGFMLGEIVGHLKQARADQVRRARIHDRVNPPRNHPPFS